MTIKNERAFMDGIWDWAILDGCFGDTRITPTDIDGLVERNGHFLIFECKSPGVPVRQGQEIMLNRAVETGFFTAMIVWGEKNKPEKLKVIGRMGNAEVDPCDKDLFRDYVKQWFKYANQQKQGIVPSPLLTRKVIDMFNGILYQTNTTNSLLLQLLDQTKSVKPIKRGNVVSINGSLFGEST